MSALDGIKGERCLVQVVNEVPVFQELQPVVGKVYVAVKGIRQHTSCRQVSHFCIIDVRGKPVVLRNPCNKDPEYEEVAFA